MLVHLQETYQGRSLFLSWFLWIKVAVIIFYVVVIFSSNSLLVFYDSIIAGIFFVEFIRSCREIFSHTLRRPVPTIKILFLTMLSLYVISFLYAIPLISDSYVWLLFLDRFVVVVISIMVFLLSFPTEMYKDYIVEKATIKLKTMDKLLVIGVTGSYGKSSTKEYIAQVLATKFNVVKTKGTNNTPIGVAKTILSQINKDTDIFIVEMGAYKKGEIEELCSIVHPKIGVLTGISAQHMSLFGSLEKTMQAKYELIESLPKDGLAIFNGNNKNVEILYKQTKKPKVFYKTNFSLAQKARINEKKSEQSIFADTIDVGKDSLSFRVKLKNHYIPFKTMLVGAHVVDNILPAIFLGAHLGMKEKALQNAILQLTPLPQTMILTTLQTGAVSVNDSFNTNPHAVLAVLEYMKLYKKKKILVFSPIIELGKHANLDHYMIGKAASKLCDYIFLTNKNYHASFMKGVEEGGGKCLVEVASFLEITHFILTRTQNGDVVVFEGKETDVVLKKTSIMKTKSL